MNNVEFMVDSEVYKDIVYFEFNDNVLYCKDKLGVCLMKINDCVYQYIDFTKEYLYFRGFGYIHEGEDDYYKKVIFYYEYKY